MPGKLERKLSPRALVAAICAAEILGMATFATFPALIPVFQPAWSLSNTEVGWISGVYFAGYVAAVPVLVSLTDRVDARRIYLVSMALSGLAAIGFAIAASGLWTATLWRFLQGVGLAGTYMPGLKALTDRVPAEIQSRSVAFYTSSFGIGSSLSFLIAGEAAAVLDWRWAFILSALGPALAFALAAAVMRPRPPHADHVPAGRLLDFRPVFANRAAIAYTLAYMVHNAELFALRSWVVAYLAYVQTQHSTTALGMTIPATVIATVVTCASMPGSIMGNEIARKLGRPPVLFAVMSVSAVTAVVLGFGTAMPYWLLLVVLVFYGVTVAGDSATLTAGVVELADPSLRGATMAVHAMIGFVGSTLGPIIFGLVLDIGGGETKTLAWGAAYTVIALILMAGPVFIYTMGRPKD